MAKAVEVTYTRYSKTDKEDIVSTVLFRDGHSFGHETVGAEHYSILVIRDNASKVVGIFSEYVFARLIELTEVNGNG